MIIVLHMLIEQEMSKEKDSKKHNSPNVIAQLMGLEALPKGEPDLRSHGKDYYSQHVYGGHLGSPFKHWKVEDRFMDKEMLHEVHLSTEKFAHKNGYELGRWSEQDDVVDKEKMALIRRKFMEAKRLSTDERLRESKQFEDALDVLSSNSDVLIKLLDSQNLHEPHSSPIDETIKPITLIKPLKMFDNDKSAGKGKKNDRMVKRPANFDQDTVWENKNHRYSPVSQKIDEFPVQSTRIVILKPSPGRTPELKSFNSPTTSSPQNLQIGNFYQGFGDEDDVLESIKLARKADLRSYQKDKTLHSSIFDESSCDKPYHEYNTPGNFIDLETMSPLPRHSWDHNYMANCWGSPYSTLSLGRASCSPESSVCLEAKKRLSERWSMMALNNKGSQEQRRLQNRSTLGEMLSLSRVKKSAASEVGSIDDNEDQEPRKSVSCRHEEISIHDSPKNVPRSNSLPASSTVYENGVSKAQGSKAVKKSKSIGSSFKGKVTSFLFSRNKKSTKKKSSTSQSNDESQSTVTETSVFPASSGVFTDDESESFSFRGFEECSLAGVHESPSRTSTVSVSNEPQHDMITLEHGLTQSKPMAPEISSENQDQPSPISVLETPFRDYNAVNDSLKGDHQGSEVPMKSNLIDKSPLIESVARTLSWHDSCEEVASSHPLKSSEQEWILLVQKLLSVAGLDHDQENSKKFHTRFHSLESPLDPSLRDTYANMNNNNNKPFHHESLRRKVRSNQKLVFDFVNAALLEEAAVGYDDGPEKNHLLKRRMCSGAQFRPILVDHIVGQMKELMWEDGASHVVESVVRREAVKVGWDELMRLEIDVLGSEIEGELMQELVENAVIDFTGRS